MRNKILSLILSFSMLSSLGMANTETVIPYENQYYKMLNDYEYALTPIIGAVICGSVGGSYGAAAGFLIGVIDESLIYSGYSSEKHLTAGLLGFALASNLKMPTVVINQLIWNFYVSLDFIPQMIGFGLGTALSTGAIAADSTQLAKPVSAIMSGASYAHSKGMPGYEGVLLGIGILGLDYAMNTDQMCNALTVISMTSALAPLATGALTSVIAYIPITTETLTSTFADIPLAESTGILLYAYFTNQTNTTKDAKDGGLIQSPEQLNERLASTFQKLTGTDIVSSLQRKQITYKIATAILSSILDRKFSIHRQALTTHMGALVPGGIIEQSRLDSALSAIGIFLIPYVAHMVSRNFVNQFQAETLNVILKEAYHNKLHTGEAPLYLKSEMEIESDVHKFYDNLNTLSGQGIQIISSTTDSYTTALYASLVLYKNNALDVVSVLNSYSAFISSILGELQSKQSDNRRALELLNGNLSRYEIDIRDKADQVVKGRKQSLLLTKISDLEINIRKIEADNFKWQMLEQVVIPAQHIFNAILSYGLISRKTTYGDLAPALVMAARGDCDNLLESGNWLLKNKDQLNTVQMASDSVNRVLDHLATPCDQNSSLQYSNKESEQNSIQIKNFKLGITKDTNTKQSVELLTLDDVEISAGRYVVTGVKGSGKSSFLSKIRGIRCNGVYAHGSIHYNYKHFPEVYEVTQKDYVPPFSSMLEIVTNKTAKELEGDEAIREKVKKYFLDLKIDDKGENGIASNLDEVKNWDFLSGGQMKTVSLITALLRKPDFLILDETFAGMDKETIQNAQKLIREELKETVIFVVDHEAKANNFDSFYPMNLHLEDHQLTLRPF